MSLSVGWMQSMDLLFFLKRIKTFAGKNPNN